MDFGFLILFLLTKPRFLQFSVVSSPTLLELVVSSMLSSLKEKILLVIINCFFFSIDTESDSLYSPGFITILSNVMCFREFEDVLRSGVLGQKEIDIEETRGDW